MSEGSRLYCSPQSCEPSETFTSSLRIISFSSSRNTRIIITARTLSNVPTCCGSVPFPLKRKTVLHAKTRNFGIRDSMLMMLSVMPSERYSELKSLPATSVGRTARESISSSFGSVNCGCTCPVAGSVDISTTSATKRYPRRGTVSMNLGLSRSSPSVFRNIDMLTVMLFSSTIVSGQISFISSSLTINSPRRSTRNSNRSRTFGLRGTALP